VDAAHAADRRHASSADAGCGPMRLSPMIWGLLVVLGLMVGSFLNVCIWRMPREESIVRPRSHCPSCNRLIAWYDNLPLISYVLLGARCRHCRARISWRYPVVEALTAAAFVGVVAWFGLSLRVGSRSSTRSNRS